MKINSQVYKIIGMNKDLSNASFDPKYSWHNKNVRLTARDSNNLFNITNEKGNLQLLFNDITPIKPVDYIYIFNFSDYLLEQIEEVYTYDILFDDYLVEQADGWVPPITYEYNIDFENYLVEQYQDIEYDSIIGGIITTNGVVNLTIDSDKEGYVVLPDNSLVYTENGIIDTIWTGINGNIDYYIQKENTSIEISNSGLSGDIVASGDFDFLTNLNLGYNQITQFNASALVNLTALYLNSNQLTTFDSSALTNLINLDLGLNQITSFDTSQLINLNELQLYDNQLTSINTDTLIYLVYLNVINNELTSQAIGDILLSLIQNNSTASGIGYFTGGTNAAQAAIDSYLITQGTTLSATLAALSSWDIQLNP